jgi:hypothetical protein
MFDRKSLSRGLLLPARDVLQGLDRCLDAGPWGLLTVACGLLAGWWIYVPLHELLHAGACLAAGGTVSRLEIDPIYGGSLLARVFPLIVPASAYAGRLSGFDTHGSDAIYLATDLGPFLLAILPGSWALRRAVRSRHPLLYGLALPAALAPFLSLTGDAYEIGSILITRLPPWSDPPLRLLLRGDDLPKKLQELAALPPTVVAPWGGAALAALTAVAWAFLTYKLGDRVAAALGEEALP